MAMSEMLDAPGPRKCVERTSTADSESVSLAYYLDKRAAILAETMEQLEDLAYYLVSTAPEQQANAKMVEGTESHIPLIRRLEIHEADLRSLNERLWAVLARLEVLR